MTTSMSVNGQIVIPAPIRERLKLGKGDDFTVTEQAGGVLLKKIQPDPPPNKFDRKKSGGLRP